MKLIEQFSRLHHQEKKLKKILEQPHNEKWLICYLSHYDDPHFSVFRPPERKWKSVVFKVLDGSLVYVKHQGNITDDDISDAKALLNDALKAEHQNWTEILI